MPAPEPERVRAILERIADRLDAALDEPDIWDSYVVEALSEARDALSHDDDEAGGHIERPAA